MNFLGSVKVDLFWIIFYFYSVVLWVLFVIRWSLMMKIEECGVFGKGRFLGLSVFEKCDGVFIIFVVVDEGGDFEFWGSV